MKSKYLFLPIILLPVLICAQNAKAYLYQGNAQYTNSGSRTVFSVLGDVINGVDFQTGFRIIHGPNPFLAVQGISTNVSEIKPIKGISVFPNPVGSEINVQIENAGEDMFLIKLFDPSGKQVLSEKWDTSVSRKQLPVHHLQTGAWQLVITDPKTNRLVTYTLIKK